MMAQHMVQIEVINENLIVLSGKEDQSYVMIVDNEFNIINEHYFTIGSVHAGARVEVDRVNNKIYAIDSHINSHSFYMMVYDFELNVLDSLVYLSDQSGIGGLHIGTDFIYSYGYTIDEGVNIGCVFKIDFCGNLIEPLRRK